MTARSRARRRPSASLIAVAVLVSCGGEPSAREPARAEAAPYPNTRSAIDDLAADAMRANAITGISLALVDRGEVAWATGWGWADFDRHIAANERTIYAVGSLSKPVTVAVAFAAIEAGELALDDTLAELLPELELAGEAEAAITLGDLLRHQSGLASDWYVHNLSASPPPWTELVGELRGVAPLYPPNTLTLYSNVGLTLAGIALGRASGRAFEDVAAERVLLPAGMGTARFGACGPTLGYRRMQPREDPVFRLTPAGGLHASVLDLAAFARLILAQGRAGEVQVLQPEHVRAMLQPQNEDLALDLDERFGYGWFLGHRQLDWVGRVALHRGKTYYHQSILILLPDRDLAVAVASNSLTAARAVETLAVETLVLALQERDELDAPSPAGAPTHATVAPEVAARFVEAHAGDYATNIGLARIEARDGEGGIEIWASERAGDNRIHLDGPDGGTIDRFPGEHLSFADVEGRHLMFLERGGRRLRSAVRLEPPGELSPAWLARVGPWRLIEREGEFSTITEPALRVVDGRLRLEFLERLDDKPMPIVLALEPLDDRRVRIAGLGRGQGDILEIREREGVEALWWAGSELVRAGAE